MKGKTILSLAIVLSLLLGVLPLAAVKAADPVRIEILFENGLNTITKAPCNNFDAFVKITLPVGVSITFVELEIHWDPTVLELQTGTSSDVIEGPWMDSFGNAGFLVQEPDNVAGILPDIADGYLAGGPATGSGVFCTIKFHAKAAGTSAIEIFAPAPPGIETYLLNGGDLVNIDESVNGETIVEVPTPTPIPPEAVFTLAPSYVQGVTINLDGSSSINGYDPVPYPPGYTENINDWAWAIDEGNDGSIEYNLNGMNAAYDHTPGFVGTVAITLTVTAPDAHPPAHPGYVDHDSLKLTTTILIPATGPYIDIYTDFPGQNGEEPDGALPEPMDWVTHTVHSKKYAYSPKSHTTENQLNTSQ